MQVDPDVGTRTLVAELNGLDAPLCRFEHLEPSLHEIFVQQVKSVGRPVPAPEVTHA